MVLGLLLETGHAGLLLLEQVLGVAQGLAKKRSRLNFERWRAVYFTADRFMETCTWITFAATVATSSS